MKQMGIETKIALISAIAVGTAACYFIGHSREIFAGPILYKGCEKPDFHGFQYSPECRDLMPEGWKDVNTRIFVNPHTFNLTNKETNGFWSNSPYSDELRDCLAEGSTWLKSFFGNAQKNYDSCLDSISSPLKFADDFILGAARTVADTVAVVLVGASVVLAGAALSDYSDFFPSQSA